MNTTEQMSSRLGQRTSTLQWLKNSNLKLADPNADIRDRKVRDNAGEDIGKVHDLLVDEGERKVRFIEVTSGGVLGLGDTKFLVPVEAVARVTDDEVQIHQTRGKVVDSPRYDPQLIEQPLLSDLYGYYGYHIPFWRSGYQYPRFPYL